MQGCLSFIQGRVFYSNKHITAQQHFKKSFTLQQGMLRAVVIPLDLWISSAAFPCILTFSMTEEMSECLCSILYSVLHVDWVQRSQATRALKPCFLLSNYSSPNQR